MIYKNTTGGGHHHQAGTECTSHPKVDLLKKKSQHHKNKKE